MRVLGADPAGGFGYALYDTDKPVSAIESGSLKLEGDNIVEKLTDLRLRFVPIVKEFQPHFAGVESPFKFAPRYQKQPKRDLLTGVVVEQPAEGETTINPGTISDCGQIAGAATAILLCWNVRCMQIPPRTWQAIIPSNLRQLPDPKKRAKAYCDMLRIASPNIDSRDAALIAVWTANHAQELKLMERTRAA